MFVLAVPVAQAAELAIRVVVLKSARVSLQGATQEIHAAVEPRADGGLRLVFTP